MEDELLVDARAGRGALPGKPQTSRKPGVEEERDGQDNRDRQDDRDVAARIASHASLRRAVSLGGGGADAQQPEGKQLMNQQNIDALK